MKAILGFLLVALCVLPGLALAEGLEKSRDTPNLCGGTASGMASAFSCNARVAGQNALLETVAQKRSPRRSCEKLSDSWERQWCWCQRQCKGMLGMKRDRCWCQCIGGNWNHPNGPCE